MSCLARTVIATDAGRAWANKARQYISETTANWMIQIQKITLGMVWSIATTVELVSTRLATARPSRRDLVMNPRLATQASGTRAAHMATRPSAMPVAVR
jgi:hypothetical protein